MSVSGYRRGECSRCKARTGVATTWHVRPWGGYYAARVGATHLAYGTTACVDAAACAERVETRRRRQQVRGGQIVVVEPPHAGAPRGTCNWCGGQILRADGRPDRRRAWHYGESSRHWLRVAPPEGESDCYAAQLHWRTYDAPTAVMREAELAGRVVLRCADCNREVARAVHPPDGAYDGAWPSWRAVVPWEADHEQPVADGGAHDLDNLRARCVPCHRAKTAREARARAAARRT